MAFFFFGDILAKNMYVALMVVFKHHFIPIAEEGSAAKAGAEDSRMARRRPSQMITQEMIGAVFDQKKSPARSSTDCSLSASGRTSATRQIPAADLEVAREMRGSFRLGTAPAAAPASVLNGSSGSGGGSGVRTAAALPDSAAVSAAVQAAVQAGFEHGLSEASFNKQRQGRTRQKARQEDSDDSDAAADSGLAQFPQLKVRRCPAHARAQVWGRRWRTHGDHEPTSRRRPGGRISSSR